MFTNCKTQRDILPLSPHVTLDYQTKIFKADLNVLGIQFSLLPTKPVIFFLTRKTKPTWRAGGSGWNVCRRFSPHPHFPHFKSQKERKFHKPTYNPRVSHQQSTPILPWGAAYLGSVSPLVLHCLPCQAHPGNFLPRRA